ncbi:MAG: hypothetical protein AB7U63_17905, partial [Porticoccaceae bacterium]
MSGISKAVEAWRDSLSADPWLFGTASHQALRNNPNATVVAFRADSRDPEMLQWALNHTPSFITNQVVVAPGSEI